MNRKFMFSTAILTLICMLSIFVMPQGKVFADMADGTYSVNYQILQAESDSVSMANDYFEKPATLIVENGVKYIQYTVNHSDWIKALQAPQGSSFVDVNVVSENKTADTRVVKFKVDDLSKPLPMKMHVLIESMDPVYDHQYTVRYDFDIDNKKEIQTAAATANDQGSNDKKGAAGATSDKSGEKEDNPKTGDNTPIMMFGILLIVSALVLLGKRKVIKF